MRIPEGYYFVGGQNSEGKPVVGKARVFREGETPYIFRGDLEREGITTKGEVDGNAVPLCGAGVDLGEMTKRFNEVVGRQKIRG